MSFKLCNCSYFCTAKGFTTKVVHNLRVSRLLVPIFYKLEIGYICLESNVLNFKKEILRLNLDLKNCYRTRILVFERRHKNSTKFNF